MKPVDQQGHRVAVGPLLLDHLLQVLPAEAGSERFTNGVHRRIGLVQIIRQHRRLALGEVDLLVEVLDAHGVVVADRLELLLRGVLLLLHLVRGPISLDLGEELPCRLVKRWKVDPSHAGGRLHDGLAVHERLEVVVLAAGIDRDASRRRSVLARVDPLLKRPDLLEQRLERGLIVRLASGERLPPLGVEPRAPDAIAGHLRAVRGTPRHGLLERGLPCRVPERRGERLPKVVRDRRRPQLDRLDRVRVLTHRRQTLCVVSMRPQQREHAVFRVHEDDVPAGEELEQHFDFVIPGSERQLAHLADERVARCE